MLVWEESNGYLHGIKTGAHSPAISHLLYADDLLITYKASESNVGYAMERFQHYCYWTGQEANI